MNIVISSLSIIFFLFVVIISLHLVISTYRIKLPSHEKLLYTPEIKNIDPIILPENVKYSEPIHNKLMEKQNKQSPIIKGLLDLYKAIFNISAL